MFDGYFFMFIYKSLGFGYSVIIHDATRIRLDTLHGMCGTAVCVNRHYYYVWVRNNDPRIHWCIYVRRVCAKTVQLAGVNNPSDRTERVSRGSSGVHSLATIVPDVVFSFSDDQEIECTVETTPWTSGGKWRTHPGQMIKSHLQYMLTCTTFSIYV